MTGNYPFLFAAPLIGVAILLFSLIVLGDYLTYRDLQKRLKKERGKIDG